MGINLNGLTNYEHIHISCAVCVCVYEQDAGYEGVMRMPKILEASPLPVLVLYVSGSKDLAGGEWGVTQWRGQDIMRWGG